MTKEDIFALMDRFEAGSSTSFKVTTKDFSLELGKGGSAVSAAAPVSAAPAAPKAPEGDYITAPLVGTYYSAAAPDQPPFVKVGDRVKKGQTVCLMEAMKMMSEVPAPFDCVVEALLCEDGALVGFGDPLLRCRVV